MSITDIRPYTVLSVSCYLTDSIMYPVNTDLLSERRENCFFHILMICTFYFAIELFQFIANFCHFLDLVIKGLYRLHRTKGTVLLPYL